MTHGTVLFPRDSLRRLEIIWRDSVNMSLPDRAIARGDRSRWALFPGISLGTCMEDLERLNAKPFSVFGFGWDYGGTVSGWHDGRLDSLWTPRLVVLRFQPTAPVENQEDIAGENVFSTLHPALRASRPCVREMVVRPR